MPLVGVSKAAGDVIDVVSMDNSGLRTEMIKDSDLLAYESMINNGSLSNRIKKINDIPEKSITLDQLIMNLASSGNDKHAKLASDLIDLNLVQGNASDNLGSSGSDKV